MGTIVAISGVAILALAISVFRGPSQGGAVVLGALLMGLGVWLQRRKSIDWSPGSSDKDQLKDCPPGTLGQDPRPLLEQHSANEHDDVSSSGDHD
jgi:hypothetical protein